MVEDVETPSEATKEEEEYAEWLESLAGEDEDPVVAEAEEEAEAEDDKAIKMAQAASNKLDAFLAEKKLEDIEEQFIAKATEGARELLTIYRNGDESPSQLKKLMQRAITKDQEAQKRGLTPEEKDNAEKEAQRIASEQYGAGPIGTSRGVDPEDDWEAARKKVRSGDMHTAFAMFNSLPCNGETTSAD